MNDKNQQQNEEVIDVESFAKAGKKVPPAKSYQIRVDKEKVIVNTATIKGKEILDKVGKTHATHNLYQHIRGQQTKPIAAEDVVDLTAPGVERFTTMKLENQEGEEERAMRRSFKLLPEDEEFLNAHYKAWETISEGETNWLLIDGFRVPAGYNVAVATIALRIPPAYRDAQIDMAYFAPDLSRADNKPMIGLTPLNIDGRTFQQWSRHRGPNQWRPDIDNIETHLLYVTAFLEGELKK